MMNPLQENTLLKFPIAQRTQKYAGKPRCKGDFSAIELVHDPRNIHFERNFSEYYRNTAITKESTCTT